MIGRRHSNIKTKIVSHVTEEVRSYLVSEVWQWRTIFLAYMIWFCLERQLLEYTMGPSQNGAIHVFNLPTHSTHFHGKTYYQVLFYYIWHYDVLYYCNIYILFICFADLIVIVNVSTDIKDI